MASVLSSMVSHYHRTLSESTPAQWDLRRLGLTDPDMPRTFKVGSGTGKLRMRSAEAQQFKSLSDALVIPLPDHTNGEAAGFYGRKLQSSEDVYVPDPPRGILNFQAARGGGEVILAGGVIEALSFYAAGLRTAIPVYPPHGLSPDHLDLFKREQVKVVTLALGADIPSQPIAETLTQAGIEVRIATLPQSANAILREQKAGAGEALRAALAGAEPFRTSQPNTDIRQEADELSFSRDGLTYRVRLFAPVLGRFRVNVRLESSRGRQVDTVDLYSSRSRSEFARRASRAVDADADKVEEDLLNLLGAAEKATQLSIDEKTGPPPMTEAEREEAFALLRRPDLLDQTAKDIDALGYVGEDANKRLLCLVAVSRKLADPLSAIVLSQCGAGKSGISDAIERLTPPEDIVFLTRITPQALFYCAPGFLDKKLVIVEERNGSSDADYSLRVLQSRKKLIAAVPVKDAQSGGMRTKVFTIEARAAFLEATTAGTINHENATRCFEVRMDESPEQTRRIQERQRLLKTEAGLAFRVQTDAVCKRHWNAQRLLEALPVVIPFAEKLAFPCTSVRTRRDHARFLNLIEASALLHQYQRERKNGAVVASVEDYRIAYVLAQDVLTEALTDVKRSVREAYSRIARLVGGTGASVSLPDVREALGAPDTTVRYWLEDLVTRGYLKKEGGGQGRPARYRLTNQSPKTVALGLLDPAEIER